MGEASTLTGKLVESFANVINDVDESIGENRDYGAGIGPHDEDDQVDALVESSCRHDIVSSLISGFNSKIIYNDR